MDEQVYLETERTILRNLTSDDAKDFYELNLDIKVVKYTGDKAFDNIETAKRFLVSYDQYKKYKVGRLAVIEKATSKFMGWCGLKYCPDKDEYDIGFRFFKKYWNKGFATETSKKCIENGFEKLGIEIIIGRAMKENIASIIVLEKLGMIFKENFNFDEKVGNYYELTKKEFEIKNNKNN